MRHRRTLLALFMAVALVAAACGGYLHDFETLEEASPDFSQGGGFWCGMKD